MCGWVGVGFVWCEIYLALTVSDLQRLSLFLLACSSTKLVRRFFALATNQDLARVLLPLHKCVGVIKKEGVKNHDGAACSMHLPLET